MIPDATIDLVHLWEHVPPLLEACLFDDQANVQLLRLVSKEASRIALLGLKSYTLRLTGAATDTNVNGTRLLRNTRLQSLDVQLQLTGSYSPAVLLAGFVREAGLALSTVTQLELALSDTCGSSSASVVLEESFALLASACPALTSIICFGAFSPAQLGIFGSACPQLSTLTIHAHHSELPYLKTVVQLLPSILPSLTSLALPDLRNELPDLSECKQIISLDITSFVFYTASSWLCLPPHLQSLVCEEILSGPPACQSETYHTLTRLDVVEADMHVHALAQVLAAANQLQEIRAGSFNESDYSGWLINCSYSLSSAADLRLVHSMIDSGLRIDASYVFSGEDGDIEGSLQPFIAALPSMERISRCIFDPIPSGEIGKLLKAFSMLQRMTLYAGNLHDVELQEISACSHLCSLSICDGSEITPMGLFALCLRLPQLHVLSCLRCTFIKEPHLERCVQLLAQQGRVIDILCADS